MWWYRCTAVHKYTWGLTARSKSSNKLTAKSHKGFISERIVSFLGKRDGESASMYLSLIIRD